MSERALRVVLGDQLTADVAALRGASEGDVILMAEVAEEATYVRHHKKKIAFLFAAMRGFAAQRRADGFHVRYTALDDAGNAGSILGEIERAVRDAGPFDRIILTEPGEYRLMLAYQAFAAASGVPVEIRGDDRFFCDHARFAAWAEGRKSLRMEFFYREMRREHALLMDGDAPVGGQWNFDHDNREALPADFTPPDRLRFEPDGETRAVLDLVAARFGDHFGDLEPFDWAVTRSDARRALDHFVTDCLATFGRYQDAMAAGEPYLSHGLISFYLNAGLLTPREVCAAAEAAYRAGDAPINAVEGFIRQILGWREYVRGIYWRFMPEYKTRNALSADRPLPDFYWSGETDMRCMAEAIGQTKRLAYAHHIQRLMVTGNFALLAGLAPDAVNDWYMCVYADAYEWVELPNTHGMALYADGGVLGSKPYAASGAYIDRMSNYCAGCRYDVRRKNGPDACPFNYLYWDFMMRNEEPLRRNQRVGRIYGTLDRMSDDRKAAVRADSARFLAEIGVADPLEPAE